MKRTKASVLDNVAAEPEKTRVTASSGLEHNYNYMNSAECSSVNTEVLQQNDCSIAKVNFPPLPVCLLCSFSSIRSRPINAAMRSG